MLRDDCNYPWTCTGGAFWDTSLREHTVGRCCRVLMKEWVSVPLLDKPGNSGQDHKGVMSFQGADFWNIHRWGSCSVRCPLCPFFLTHFSRVHWASTFCVAQPPWEVQRNCVPYFLGLDKYKVPRVYHYKITQTHSLLPKKTSCAPAHLSLLPPDAWWHWSCHRG